MNHVKIYTWFVFKGTILKLYQIGTWLYFLKISLLKFLYAKNMPNTEQYA